jgi:hypothetical protein
MSNHEYKYSRNPLDKPDHRRKLQRGLSAQPQPVRWGSDLRFGGQAAAAVSVFLDVRLGLEPSKILSTARF